MVDWENSSCFSRAGAELIEAIVDGQYDFDEFIEAFIEAYPGFLDSESEGCSGGAEEDGEAGSEGCSSGAEEDTAAGSEEDGNAASAELVATVQGMQL